MFKTKKNKKFSYEPRHSKEENERNIYFERKAKQSKSRLTIFFIMLILIFGLLFYFNNYIQ